MRNLWAGLVLALSFGPALAESAGEGQAVRELAPGVHLIPGSFMPDRGPDGNTVVFDAPEGLIVVDTGRHVWHSDKILAFASAQKRPIRVIVNTHWHLDHSSGNGRLKQVFPAARIYTTNAVDRVLAPGGFLARELALEKTFANDPTLSATEREEIAIFVKTMEQQDMLRPDVAIATSGAMSLAGRAFDVRVTDKAVTDADVWLLDAESGTAVVGDLVTLPAPFFETACPRKWVAALDEVWATPFKIAIPGHGEPMRREAFNTYRAAFGAFVDCVLHSAKAPQACAAAWATGVDGLLGGKDDQRKRAIAMSEYYVKMLRKDGGKSKDCLAE
ncbi:MAG: MBL fold metallo-hydrolase [Alphaproteobacteria bacterium]|nr:MBL fold metallo-hydrolase [Alphaproteobacteria bacterium]